MGSRILKNMLWLGLFGVVIYFALPYLPTIPCKNPIEYKIGTIDPRFGVSESEFKKDIAQAGMIWSKGINKTLFEYNPKGALTINLIYDDRQKITQQEKVLNTEISKTSGVAGSVKEEYSSLQSSYLLAKQSYEAELAEYNREQGDYNSRVEYWNSQGGAPKDEYAKLTAEKNSMQSKRSTLEAERVRMNNLGNQINALIDKYNLLVAHINSNVDAINNDGLAGTQFEEGEYVRDINGKRINIYQFENKTYFIRVLAHELGHAVDLDHNNNPDSIMNPVNNSQSLKLSTEDLQDLKMECEIE
jgi:Matrixin